jgi:hypothetical protein
VGDVVAVKSEVFMLALYSSTTSRFGGQSKYVGSLGHGEPDRLRWIISGRAVEKEDHPHSFSLPHPNLILQDFKVLRHQPFF